MKQTPSPNATFERAPKLSELSAARQALVRLCQSIDYGQVLDLHVRDREPVFNPEPVVILEVKLDGDSRQRPESELADFTLRDEVRRLLDRIDEIGNGRIQKIEVRAGIPRRVLIEAKLTEAMR
jgi:hypothetical protein